MSVTIRVYLLDDHEVVRRGVAELLESTGEFTVVGQGGSVAECLRHLVDEQLDVDVAVLDDQLRPIEPGSGKVGLMARGGNIPLGYYGDEAKTAATFVTAADGRRYAVPGDMATIEADGSITLLGRGSMCINTGGEKVFPEEVEQTLKAHPDVFDALVVGVADERWGQRVTAVVQARDGRELDIDDVIAHARSHIASYKVPRRVLFFTEAELQLTGSAKQKWGKLTDDHLDVIAGKRVRLVRVVPETLQHATAAIDLQQPRIERADP